MYSTYMQSVHLSLHAYHTVHLSLIFRFIKCLPFRMCLSYRCETQPYMTSLGMLFLAKGLICLSVENNFMPISSGQIGVLYKLTYSVYASTTCVFDQPSVCEKCCRLVCWNSVNYVFKEMSLAKAQVHEFLFRHSLKSLLKEVLSVLILCMPCLYFHPAAQLCQGAHVVIYLYDCRYLPYSIHFSEF